MTGRLIFILLLSLSPTADAAGIFPPRQSTAESGRAFLERTKHYDRTRREEAILRAVLAGNVPDHLRRTVPVNFRIRTAGGLLPVRLQVLPDYLAIGSDTDFVRIPVDFYTAAALATRLHMSLPTRALVDRIWQASAIHTRPHPLPPGQAMTSNLWIGRHQDRAETRLRHLPAYQPGKLVAGHKKDLVLCARLLAHPGRVPVYGWHHPDGRPLQPLSLVHTADYADYSHGLRLISRTILVDGRPMDLHTILQDPGLGPALAGEYIRESEHLVQKYAARRLPHPRLTAALRAFSALAH